MDGKLVLATGGAAGILALIFNYLFIKKLIQESELKISELKAKSEIKKNELEHENNLKTHREKEEIEASKQKLELEKEMLLWETKKILAENELQQTKNLNTKLTDMNQDRKEERNTMFQMFAMAARDGNREPLQLVSEQDRKEEARRKQKEEEEDLHRESRILDLRLECKNKWKLLEES